MNLSASDYWAILAALQRLYACDDAPRFPHLVIDMLHDMIGAHRISFEHIAPTIPEFWGIAHPHLEYLPSMWQVFLENLHEHPCIQHYFRTGDPTAVCLDDFNTVDQWHNTEIYDGLMRDIGGEEQMAVVLNPPGRPFHAVVLWRDRRTFTERDRGVFNLMRPHIAQAYRNAQAATRLRDAAGMHWLIRVDHQGRLAHPPPEALQCLRAYFDDPVRDLAVWVRHQSRTTGDAAARPLVRSRKAGRVLVRLFTEDLAASRPAAVLIEERVVPDGASHLARLGLTRREIQVLRELEAGKTNNEIAEALFISPRTVKKHFEHIYNKLGVTTRTAALARARNAEV